MSDVVVRAEGLGKKYLIGHQRQRERYTTLRDVVGRAARSLGRATIDTLRGRQIVGGDEIEEFWALKDVSFEIERGDVVGIVGRNGAGKSTLLKVLSRITEPTEGRVTLKGRVASLIEVGTGFHPELTGRENIFLNGAVLGMNRAEVRAKFDEIVAFAEVENFLDTPVKRYSSGMYLRLAFAVAAHLEPEILVVDEVLAVGDAEFQKKCLGKMKEIGTKEGRTVLFVSHNLNAVRSLCTKGLLLESGRLTAHGNVDTVLAAHSSQVRNKYTGPTSIIYEDAVRLQSITLVDADLDPMESVDIGQKVGIHVVFEILNDRYRPDIWISAYTQDGALAFGTCIDQTKTDYQPGTKNLVCWIDGNLLNATSYALRVFCIDLEKQVMIFDIHDVISFEVTEDINQRSIVYRGPWFGTVRPQLDWEFVA